MTPTLSQVKNWDIKHLTEAANHWTKTAEIWEDRFTQYATQILNPGGEPWEGEAAEAAQHRAHSDRLIVVGLADQLHDASKIARTGAWQLAEAQRRVMRSVESAQGDGFTVGEDFSVTDHHVYNRAAAALRQAKAEGYAADLRAAVRELVATDLRIAGEITTATEGLGKNPFPESGDGSGSQGGGDHKTLGDQLLDNVTAEAARPSTVTDQILSDAAGGTAPKPLSDSLLANVAGGGDNANEAAQTALYQIGKAALGDTKDWMVGVPFGYASKLVDGAAELARPGAVRAPSVVQKAAGEVKLGQLPLGSPGGLGLSGLASGVSFLVDQNKPGMTTAHAAVRNGASLVVGTLLSAPIDSTGVGIPLGIVVATGSGNATAALVDLAWEPAAQAQEVVKGLGGLGAGLSHRAMGLGG